MKPRQKKNLLILQVVVSFAKKKYIFFEVPISYYGRGYDEGKKIKTLDAFKALYCLFKYSFIKN